MSHIFDALLRVSLWYYVYHGLVCNMDQYFYFQNPNGRSNSSTYSLYEYVLADQILYFLEFFYYFLRYLENHCFWMVQNFQIK